MFIFQELFLLQTFTNDLPRNQLSPTQQGHILADIQQHHRFSLNPAQHQSFPPQQFVNINPSQNPLVLARLGQTNQNLLQNTFLPQGIQPQPLVQNPQTPIHSPVLAPISGVIQNPSLNQPVLANVPNSNIQNHLSVQNQSPNSQNQLPNNQNQHLNVQNQLSNTQNFLTNTPNGQNSNLQTKTGANNLLQHHTQTSFIPNFSQAQQPNQQIQSSQQNPNQKFRSDPIFFLDQQLQQDQLDPEKQKQRLKELKEKQAIIDKHNQFVEKQYEKALKKAQADHAAWVQKQNEFRRNLYQKIYRPPGYQNVKYSQSNRRFIYPEEAELFKLSVKKYYEEHPTTTTTTTTTTSKPTTVLITEKSKVFSKDNKKKQAGFLPTAVPSTARAKTIQSLDDLDQLQKQYKSQQIKKDDLLAQLRLAIGSNPEEELGKNVTSREISLPNGQKVQIIKTTDPNLIPNAKGDNFENILVQRSQTTTSAPPPKAIFEELTKTILPSGANFELLKAGSNGGLESVGGLPSNQKKVTFVLLEEQSDGSFKVQGVKGNDGKEKQEVDVESILKKIKDGEIKLPPPAKVQSVAPTQPTYQETQTPTTLGFESKRTTEIIPSVTILPNSFATEESISSSVPVLNTNIGTQFVASTQTTRSYRPEDYNTVSTVEVPTTQITTTKFDGSDLVRQASTASGTNQNKIYSNFGSSNFGSSSFSNSNFGSSTTKSSSANLGSSTNKPFSTLPSVKTDFYQSKSISSTLSPPHSTKNYEQIISISEHGKSYKEKASDFNGKMQSFQEEATRNQEELKQNNNRIDNQYQIGQNQENLFEDVQNKNQYQNDQYQNNQKKDKYESNQQSEQYQNTLGQYQNIKDNQFENSRTSQNQNLFKQKLSREDIGNEFDRTTNKSASSESNNNNKDIIQVLKGNGLYAMAKFLRQSGLDTILNETGPYTIFAPNDKAFRTLLVQLGGPERADEKFRENPRLLSGVSNVSLFTQLLEIYLILFPSCYFIT